MSKDGEKIHPRTSQAIIRLSDDNTKRARPTFEQLKELNIKHIQGKQFRYILFLCNKRDKKRLLQESEFNWTIDYPKDKDLEWKIKTDAKVWEKCNIPNFSNKYTFNKVKPESEKMQMTLF